MSDERTGQERIDGGRSGWQGALWDGKDRGRVTHSSEVTTHNGLIPRQSRDCEWLWQITVAMTRPMGPVTVLARSKALGLEPPLIPPENLTRCNVRRQIRFRGYL